MVGMVGFANRVDGTDLNNWASPSPPQIAFGRGKEWAIKAKSAFRLIRDLSGSIGFVAINYGTTSWVATLGTNLPDGLYCDVIHGGMQGPLTCTSSWYVHD